AEQLPSAIRLNATARYLAILLGPAVGGGLMLLLGPAWGLLTNVLIYLPLTILLGGLPYTGHTRLVTERRVGRGFGLGEALRLFTEVRSDRRGGDRLPPRGRPPPLAPEAARPPDPAHMLRPS